MWVLLASKSWVEAEHRKQGKREADLATSKGVSCLSAAQELSGKTKSMTVGIRALVGSISRKELVLELCCNVWVCLEEAMVGSHVEDVIEQDQGRGLDTPT